MLKIVFEFVGGPNDGRVLQGWLGEPSDAERYYLFTNHGTVGQRFKIASDYAVETLAREVHQETSQRRFQPHYYVVSERLEEDEDVIVRATYVEREQPIGGSHAQESGERTGLPSLAPEQLVENCLADVGRSLADSCGHCWPTEFGAPGTIHGNLALHFGHILLRERFSVLADARHSNLRLPPVALLGISPSQNWFLACAFKSFTHASDVAELAGELDALRSFWLHTGMTNETCEPYIRRIAQHCEMGLGLIAGLHWCPLGSESPLQSWWSSRCEPQPAESLLPVPNGGEPSTESTCVEPRQTSLLQVLSQIRVAFSQPLLVQSYPRHGSYHLLTLLFRIPRPREP